VFLARVVGHVVAPIQHRLFRGHKLLLVQPEHPGGNASGAAIVAVDRVDSGIGDRVLVLHEGSSARDLLDAPDGPVRAVIVGFVDDVEVIADEATASGDPS
jgi:microcompartment protein CcmK/EutM